MGVPAFFRWLSRKYPSIVVHCVEEKEKSIDGVKIPINSSELNPNGVEFDNLYLDMNGIIHPCCHPENKPAPKNENEMMIAIFEYIDRLFRIIRPRRLLYMAIDGVAPRAKMNQQRSRRFRASKETSDKITEIFTIRQRLLEDGATLPREKEKGEHFDSNCITPGTPFMDRLSVCLHYYIHDRLNSDPGWKNIEVILSDANVPGEGEHKIMDFIRKQRGSPSYDPNTKHCLCGADADLIMLGLATHEPNFTIIREEFVPNQPRPCELCGQIGHELKDCMGLPKEMVGEHDELPTHIGSEVEFIFIRLNVLREYLTRELDMQNLPFAHDIERAIDDWVFMCFFVGNDFLPHLPSLEIREGAIDRLVNLYKSTVYKTGGYLTENGIVNMQRVQMIMNDLGKMEDGIFKRRQENELAFRRRMKERNKRKRNEGPAWVPVGQFAPTPITDKPSPVQDARKEAYIMRVQGMLSPKNDSDNKNAAENIRKSLHGGNDSAGLDSPSPQQQSKGIKRKRDQDESDSEEEPHDEVRLWEDGFKDRYYASKFEISSEDVEFRHKVAAAYAKGLCWVLQYYYQGCPSWKWFFPYHYAPFASDFVDIASIPTSFEKGTKPFNPMEQLMGVFPAASRQHLPETWGELMTNSDSPIIDFYPINFKVDLNGKKFAWQGVALLPFVDERRLLKALKEVYPLLSKEEQRRNTRGHDRLYVNSSHPSYKYFISFYEGEKDHKAEYLLDPTLMNGMSGTLLLAEDAIEPGGIVRTPVRGCEDLHDNRTVCVRFQDPKYDVDHIFLSKRLPGALDPENVLKPLGLGFTESSNWRPVIGMTRSNQQASLGQSGRRMLNHSVRRADTYNSTTGPNQYSNYDRAMMARGGGGDAYRGNNTNNYQPRHQQQQQQQQQYQDYGRGGGNGGQYQGRQRQSGDQRYNQTPYCYEQQGGSSWQQERPNRRPGHSDRSRQRHPPYGMDNRSGRGGGAAGGQGGGFNYVARDYYSRPHFQF